MSHKTVDKNKNSENGRIIRRVLKFIRPYRFFVLCSILLAAVSALLSLYLPVLTGNAVDSILGEGRVDLATLRDILFRMAVIIAITSIAQWLMNVCNNHITYGTVRDIREAAMARLEILPLSYHDTHRTGEVVSRLIADADQFADGLLMGFTQFFTGVLTIVGTLILMIRINWQITLIVVCLTPLSLFVASFIAKNTYHLFKKQSEVRGGQTTIIEEMIGNEKIVQAFSYEDDADEMFRENNEQLAKVGLKALFFSSLTNPSTRFVNNMVYAGVALFGAGSVIRGGLSVGELATFLSFANQYTKPFNEISGVVTELQNAIACAGRVLDLIEEEPQEPDKPEAVALKNVRGIVDIEHVRFSYVPEQKLIRDLSLRVESGKRVAIVGPTGCGKTTLINLLMRFYDVNAGKILVDGNHVQDITRHSLRTSFGMVLQDTWLMPGTIRENITLGKPNATDEQVIRAAKAAHSHSFIRQLPRGYDTPIGEDGGALSQGQKQLICITRIMLSLPPMLILDEATSSIDTRTELKIQDAFARMMEGRTSFIVAHRLSTIREADIILVMKDGNIIEQGNHEELLARGGFYKTLYESQYALTTANGGS